MKLKWDRTTISASEVNRYTYCPYQWYFERYYGRNKLFELSKNRKQTAKTPEYQNLRRKQKIVSILVLGVILVIIVCFLIFLIK